MEYVHSTNNGIAMTPILQETSAALEGSDSRQRTYANRLEIFEEMSYDALVDAGVVQVVSSSNHKVHLLGMDFVDGGTGNVFFVVYEGVAVMLHFSVQDGSENSLSFNESLARAELLANQFWRALRS